LPESILLFKNRNILFIIIIPRMDNPVIFAVIIGLSNILCPIICIISCKWICARRCVQNFINNHRNRFTDSNDPIDPIFLENNQ
jgi:hypothetical protein